MRYSILVGIVILVLLGNSPTIAQENNLDNNYIGFLPAVLNEPYDTINAIEVNFTPLLYEHRVGNKNDIGIQFRPILNYRFFKTQSGFSQIGGTIVANKYLVGWLGDDSKIVPQIGAYYTFTYNRLDKIQTMTFGIEPGAYMKISNNYSISVSLQPGINYYPDTYSKDFVKSEKGFKSHFGVFFHIGYNF